METRATEALAAWLERHGFQVERGACGIPTAFAAPSGEGEGPAIALLAEYDALPGQGNRAVPHRAPDGRGAGHACGHNQLGPAQVGAAIAARRAIEARGLPGRLVVLGCPAEELLWGKLALLERGGFAGVGRAAHLARGLPERRALAPVPGVRLERARVHGVSRATAGPSARHNALEALELATQRDRPTCGARGSTASSSATWCGPAASCRASRPTRRGCGSPCGTSPSRRLGTPTARSPRIAGRRRGRRASPSATSWSRPAAATSRTTPSRASLDANLRLVGPPAWSADDWRGWRRSPAPATRRPRSSSTASSRLHTEGCDPYGQDDGEASWRIPLGRVNWAIPRAVPLHHWGATALSGHAAGLAGPAHGVGGAGADGGRAARGARPSSPRLARSWRARSARAPLSPPRYGDFEVMTRAPDAFWGATWGRT